MVNSNDAERECVVFHGRKAPARMSSTSTAVSVTSSVASASPPQKSFDEMSRLRKLVSLSYYSCKLKGWFHREDRDTIVCEEDEEAFRRDNFHEIIGCDEFASPAATFVNDTYNNNNNNSAVAKERASSFTSWVDSGASAVTSALYTVPTSPSSNQDETSSDYEPSKEQRWCTNCAKCFQRKLSHYDQFCGLDCKTAHRFRLVA